MAMNSDWGKNLDKICSLLLRLIRVEFYIILSLFCNFSLAACDTDTNAAMLSIVFRARLRLGRGSCVLHGRGIRQWPPCMYHDPDPYPYEALV